MQQSLAILIMGFSLLAFGAEAGTIDVSDLCCTTTLVGNGDTSYWSDKGIIFDQAYGAQLVQGDWAILSWPTSPDFTTTAVSGHFIDPMRVLRMSAFVAPTSQLTVDYTLALLDAEGNILDKVSKRVIQDTGSPDNMGFGYSQLSLGPPPDLAHSFIITSTFVERSFPCCPTSQFGLSELTWRSVGSVAQVPVPASLPLLMGALAGATYVFRRRNRSSGRPYASAITAMVCLRRF
jgi:hypothetical protein